MLRPNRGVSVVSVVSIGVAASFRPTVSVGDGARVGMGSVVVKNVLAGTQVFGDPAVDTGGRQHNGQAC